jgi:hypothetical protein
VAPFPGFLEQHQGFPRRIPPGAGGEEGKVSDREEGRRECFVFGQRDV